MLCRRAQSHATEADELVKASPELPVALAVPGPAAVLGLLRMYQRLLDEAARDRGMLKRGTAGFAVDHVRRALTTLQRRYGAYLALSDDPAPAHQQARERLSEFAATLPPPPSRWRSVALVAAVLLVARLLLVLFDEAGESSTDELGDAVSRVSDLSPQNVGDTVEFVLQADLLTIWVVAMMFGLAAYVVLRPLANGWMSSWILRRGDAASTSRWFTNERSQAARLRIDEHEAQVFEASGMRAPADWSFDLAVKACVAVPVLIGAFAYWEVFLAGCCPATFTGDSADGGQFAYVVVSGFANDAVLALVLGVAAAARLTWLMIQWRARRTRAPATRMSGTPVVAAVLTLAAGFGLMALGDDRAPSVVAAAPPIDEQILRARTFEIRVVCNEACDVGEAGFIDNDGAPADRALGEPVLAAAGDAPSRPIRDDDEGQLDLIGFDVSAQRMQSYDVRLSGEQAQWLAAQLTCDWSPGCGPAIDLVALDSAGNNTEIPLGLVSGSRR